MTEDTEITLDAPFRFDQGSGYWTGEPDLEALDLALTRVPEQPDVQRVVDGARVILRGPMAAVEDMACRLRAEGLA